MKKGLDKVVGAGDVINDPQNLDAYSMDDSFVSSKRPRLLLKPKKIYKMQTLVKRANYNKRRKGAWLV